MSLFVEPSELLAGIRNGAWLDRQDFPPLAYAVPGIIPEGSVLLVGAPKIGKSWLVQSMALAAAAGGKMLGLDVPKRPTLYVALEDGDRRIQDRCRKLLAGDPIPATFEYLTRAEPGRILDTVVEWLDLQFEPALVVLDTLGKVMPPALQGESAYLRDYRVGAAIKRIADERPGMTLLVNHHDRKANAEDFIDSVSGTHGLAGAADTVVVLNRARHEEDGLLKVTGRDVPEGEYAVRFVDGSCWVLNGENLAEAARHARDARVTAGLGDLSVEVIEFVGEHSEGVTPAQVAKGLGMERDAAGVYLRRALAANRINRPSRGLYTPVLSVLSVSGAENTKNGKNAPLGDTALPFDSEVPAVPGVPPVPRVPAVPEEARP